MDWVTPGDAKLLLEPFGDVLKAHQDFLRALAQLLSKRRESQGPPVAELMLEHAPAISAANIQFAAVVEKIQCWFEEKAAEEPSSNTSLTGCKSHTRLRKVL